MEKLDLTTPNFTNENIAKLAELFPNCVTEKKNDKGDIVSAIDFDALRQEFSGTIVEGTQERYSLNWPGKREALVTANTPISKTLRPCREESVDFDTTKNIFIEGDNLDALKLLQETYLGKVKMIYIDPPYNTGNDFIYNDNFTADKDEYDKASGQRDEEGGRLVANPDSNGRYHSDWLSMMYPRLKLARNLLRDDGVIFISIDDNEQANLKKMCDEIFGAENRLSTHHIQVRYANKTLNEKNDWQPVMEYVYIYAKNPGLFKPKKESEKYSLDKFVFEFKELSLGNEIKVKGRKVTVFKSGEWELIKHGCSSVDLLKETWVSGSIYTGTGNGQMVQKVVEPRIQIDGYGSLYKIDGLGEDGLGYRYFTGPRAEGSTRAKMFSGVPLTKVEEVNNGTAVKYKSISNLSVFEDYSPDFGNIANEGGVKYNSGKKPLKMLNELIEICNLDEDDIVLDFFAGSATTAHAVIRLNIEDGGRRKFILVQLPELLSVEVKEQKDTCTFLASINKPCILSELGKERIRRAGNKIKEDNADKEGIESLDTGFRVFKIDSSNMVDVTLAPDEAHPDMFEEQVGNIKKDRSSEDLLFQVLLDWGVDLSLPIIREEIDDKEVFFVDGNALAACFDSDINEDFVKTLAEKQPLRVVFRDDGFGKGKNADAVKINVEQIFKLKSPTTDIKVI